MEEVSDEEMGATPKKKKKKPKKKKKKTSASTTGPNAEPDTATAEVVQPPPPPAAAPTPPSPQQKKTSSAKLKKAPSVKSTTSSTVVPPFGSTASLPLPTEQTAQSGRSYIQKEGLKEKVKVKTRSDQPTLSDIPEKKTKSSIFSRFRGQKDKEVKNESQKETGDRHSFFTKMHKKTKAYMHQLLHTAEDEKQGIAPLKWEHFLKVWETVSYLSTTIADQLFRLCARWDSRMTPAPLVPVCALTLRILAIR